MFNIGVLAADEYVEIDRLLTNLIVECGIDPSQIVILFDSDKTTPIMYEIVEEHNIYNIYDNPLDGNFARQRNHLHSLCTEDYILHIDADETIPVKLIDILRNLIDSDNSIDKLAIPRVNKLIQDDLNLCPEDIFGPNPPIDSDGKIGWPDYQWRLVRNCPQVIWGGVIDEQPSGNGMFLKADESLAIQHIKNISKQLAQRDFYRTLK